MARINYSSKFGDGYAIRTDDHGDMSDGYLAARSIARKRGWRLLACTQVYDGKNIYSVTFVAKRRVGDMWAVEGEGNLYV